jgi:beta-lactamase regulating signal transducer with metallopeptidase domain
MNWTGFANVLSTHALILAAQRLAWTALESAARTAVMATAVWAGLRVLRVRQVRVQRLAWGLVLAGSAAMPLLMRWPAIPADSVVGRWMAVPVKESAPSGARPMVAVPVRVRASAVTSGSQKGFAAKASVAMKQQTGKRDFATDAVTGPVSELRVAESVEAKTATGPVQVREIWQQVVAFGRKWTAAAWLAVSVLLLLRLLAGLAMAMRIWDRAEPASALLEPRCEVRISEEIPTPVTFGSGVVLPASYTEWDRRKLRMVLAHERAHVRQGDFWLQLAAGAYACVFWFSPVSWWMKRRLAELGETLSDRAAVDESADRPGYAEVLLEFAATPRRTARMAAMTGMSIAGWGLPRGGIRRRIEFLLTEGQFKMAFTTSRIHVMAALVLVPAAVVAATSPVMVQAAGTKQEAPAAQATPVAPSPADAASAQADPVPQAVPAPQTATPDTAPGVVLASPVAPVEGVDAPVMVMHAAPIGPVAFQGPVTVVGAMPVLPPMDGPVVLQAVQPGMDMGDGPITINTNDSDDGKDAWAVVSGDSTSISGAWSGRFFEDAQKLKEKEHGSYILYRRNGKTYVIDDPALVEQSEKLFAPLHDLGQQQAKLGEQQARLGAEQAQLGRLQSGMQIRIPNINVSIDTKKLQEEIKQAEEINQKRIADLQAKLQNLPPDLKVVIPNVTIDTKQLQLQMKQLDEMKLNDFHGPDMSAVQQQVANIQARFGAMQGQMAGGQAALGEKQAKLGEQQAQLGKQQAELGQQQSKIAEQANTSMKMMLDQAVKDGKAKPVE